MIYRRYLFGWIFFERWNTPQSASGRLKELSKHDIETMSDWQVAVIVFLASILIVCLFVGAAKLVWWFL